MWCVGQCNIKHDALATPVQWCLYRVSSWGQQSGSMRTCRTDNGALWGQERAKLGPHGAKAGQRWGNGFPAAMADKAAGLQLGPIPEEARNLLCHGCG